MNTRTKLCACGDYHEVSHPHFGGGAMSSATEQALEVIEKALTNQFTRGTGTLAALNVANQGLIDARHILKQQLADDAQLRPHHR